MEKYSWDLTDIIQETISKIPEEGRFCGGRKVYISAVQANLGMFIDMDTFKELLIKLHTAGELHLERIDMPAFGDPMQLAESEIRHLGAVYHVIVDKDKRF